MREPEREDFPIRRHVEGPLLEDPFEIAANGAVQISEDLAEGGVGLQWIESHVRTQPNGMITGTGCHDRAENASAIRAHADRAGRPVSRIARLGETRETQ